MDQTIENELYRNRIAKTASVLSGERMEGKNGNVMAKDGHSYYIDKNNILRPILNPNDNKIVKACDHVLGKLKDQGLILDAKKGVVSESICEEIVHEMV